MPICTEKLQGSQAYIHNENWDNVTITTRAKSNKTSSTLDERTLDTSSIFKSIKNDFPGLAYTQLSKLLEAQIYVTEKNYKDAEDVLLELIAYDSVKGLNEVASSRLARLYLAQNDPNKAFEVISGIENKLEGTLLELRADIAAAMGENEKADALYEQALKQSELLGYPTNNLVLKKNNLSARRANIE